MRQGLRHNASDFKLKRAKDDLVNRIRPLLALLLIAVYASTLAAQDAQTPQELCDAAEPAPLTMMQFKAAENALEPGKDYRAILCTSAGAIYIDLYESLTPVTVNNFVFLAGQGYYDSTTFHRVIPDFMAQGGDPAGTGRGGPGYRFGDEPVGFLTFDRPGLLAMANAGPGTNGGQFFITTAPTPHLNYKHTIFGDVLAGQEVVEAIRERDPATATEPGEALQTMIIITDPSAVDSNEAKIAPATQEEVIAAFETFAKGLPPVLSLVDEHTGYFSTEALAAASVAEDLQNGFATFAAKYGHQYRARLQIANGGCDDSVFFSALGFWVDVYADASSADAARRDDFMRLWLDSYGYTQEAESATVYLHSAKTCGGEEGVHLLSLNPRGRFLATLDVLVAKSVLDQVPAAALLNNLSLQIEGALAHIFRAEIR